MRRGGRRKAVAGLLIGLGVARGNGADEGRRGRRAAAALTAVKAVKAVKKVGYVKLLLIVAVPLLAVVGVLVVVILVAASFIDSQVEAAAGVQQIQQACIAGGSTGAGAEAPASTGQGALPPEQIAQLAAGAGFTGGDVVTAVAVALAESGGRPDANNAGTNSNGTVDYGLFQINSVHAQAGFDVSRAYDPAYNAAWAHRIFTNAGGWTPWVAYNTGVYRRHLAEAERAAAGVDPAAVVPVSDDPAAAEICEAVGVGTAVGAAVGMTGPPQTIETIEEQIGQPVPAYSVLRDPAAFGTGDGGPSVNMLAPQMRVAIARLEILMGVRLQVTSGYRTAEYQAELCTRVPGPCAAPGRSMHQQGLAVDVTNWRQALPHLSQVGLCQPLPENDAVHLSHVDGREC